MMRLQMLQRTRRTALEVVLLAVFVGWTVWTLAHYTEGHQLFSSWHKELARAVRACIAETNAHFLENLGTSLRALLSFGLMTGVVVVLGAPVTRRWFDGFTGIERWLVTLASGAFVLHFVMLLFGVLGLWSVGFLRVFVGLVFLLGARFVPMRPREPVSAADLWRGTGLVGWVGITAAVWISWTAIEGLAPETAADATVYHVGVPSRWLMDGGIHFIRDHYASNLPLPHSMFYTLLLALGPANATGLMQPLLLLLTAAATHQLIRRAVGDGTEYVPVALWCVLAVPALNGYLAVSGNDQFTITFFALGLWLGVRSLDASDTSVNALVLAGACLGMGMAAKYTAWSFAVIAAVYISLEWLLRRRPWRPLLGALGLGALPAAVWALKNVILTGNPVYPAMSSVFGTAHTFPEGIARAVRTNVSTVENLRELVEWPYVAAFERVVLMHNPGPQWIWLFPVAVLASFYAVRDRGALARALVFLVAGWAAWGLTFTNGRYAGPIFLATALAIGLVFQRAIAGARLKPLWTAAVVIPLMGSTAMGWAYRRSIVLADTYLCGAYDATDYATQPSLLLTTSPPDGMFRWLNEHLSPARHRVLLIGETRTVGLEIPYFSGNEYDRPVFRRYVVGAADVGEIRDRIEAEGVTHIALNIAAGKMYEGYSFHILTLEPPRDAQWSAFLSTTDLLVRHTSGTQDWAVVEVIPKGQTADQPAPDLMREVFGDR